MCCFRDKWMDTTGFSADEKQLKFFFTSHLPLAVVVSINHAAGSEYVEKKRQLPTFLHMLEIGH